MSSSAEIVRASRQISRACGVDVPIRVLCVDDDAIFHTLLARRLRATQTFTYVLDSADSVASAWPLVCQQIHDIYLIDYFMPDGDGLNLVRMAADAGFSIPFLLITDSSSEAVTSEAHEMGALGVLYKFKDSFASNLETFIYRGMGNYRAMQGTAISYQHDKQLGQCNPSRQHFQR